MLIRQTVPLNPQKRSRPFGFFTALIACALLTGGVLNSISAYAQDATEDEATQLLGPEQLRDEVREIIDESEKYSSDIEVKDAEEAADTGRRSSSSKKSGDLVNAPKIFKLLKSEDDDSFASSLAGSSSSSYESESTITSSYENNLSQTTESVSTEVSSIVESANRDVQLKKARASIEAALSSAGIDASHPEINALLSNIDPNIDIKPDGLNIKIYKEGLHSLSTELTG